MSLVGTLPGKIGDALLQYPVLYQYCVQNNLRCQLWLDKGSLKPLVPLFEAQPIVESVRLLEGIQNYTCGGQPYDFGLQTADHLDHEIIHLGFRRFPQKQITLETLDNLPLVIDKMNLGSEPCFARTEGEDRNRLVLHGTFTSHQSGVPSFWRALRWLWPDLQATFEDIVFVGTKGERARALELYPDAQEFEDQGDFLKLAGLLEHSRFVIGSGSCVVALASVIKVPSLRIHDPIGNLPKTIWSGLGRHQFNETERELRRSWERIHTEALAGKVLV